MAFQVSSHSQSVFSFLSVGNAEEQSVSPSSREATIKPCRSISYFLPRRHNRIFLTNKQTNNEKDAAGVVFFFYDSTPVAADVPARSLCALPSIFSSVSTLAYEWPSVWVSLSPTKGAKGAGQRPSFTPADQVFSKHSLIRGASVGATQTLHIL